MDRTKEVDCQTETGTSRGQIRGQDRHMEWNRVEFESIEEDISWGSERGGELVMVRGDVTMYLDSGSAEAVIIEDML